MQAEQRLQRWETHTDAVGVSVHSGDAKNTVLFYNMETTHATDLHWLQRRAEVTTRAGDSADVGDATGIKN